MDKGINSVETKMESKINKAPVLLSGWSLNHLLIKTQKNNTQINTTG